MGTEPESTGLPAADGLERIRKRLQPLLAREERARELAQSVPLRRVYVGASGVTSECGAFDIVPDFLTLRVVENAPGIVHVCRAARRGASDYLGVARYSHSIGAEIAVGSGDSEEHLAPRFLHDIAWHTAALLKLRGAEPLFCPASSSVSWDLLAGVEDQSVELTMLDDVPKQILTCGYPEYSITSTDLEWVRDGWDRALELRDASTSRRFGLAFNVAYTWNHTQEPRIAISNLWCGLDALFGKQDDRLVTKRLSQRIADWLLNADEGKIAELYEARCDAIHGRWMNDAELSGVLRRTAQLLRDSITRCIDEGRRTLPDWGQ